MRSAELILLFLGGVTQWVVASNAVRHLSRAREPKAARHPARREHPIGPRWNPRIDRSPLERYTKILSALCRLQQDPPPACGTVDQGVPMSCTTDGNNLTSVRGSVQSSRMLRGGTDVRWQSCVRSVPARPPEGHCAPPSGGSDRSERGGPSSAVAYAPSAPFFRREPQRITAISTWRAGPARRTPARNDEGRLGKVPDRPKQNMVVIRGSSTERTSSHIR